MAKSDLIGRPHLADSTNVRSYGYSEQRATLAIEFKSGAIFHYRPVNIDVFEGLHTAKSKGSFFAKHIKGKFPSEKMTGICPNCKITGILGEKCDCGMGTFTAIDNQHKEPADLADPIDQVRR